jgi:pimeloyl-ACP methyl ester carboxylesterase
MNKQLSAGRSVEFDDVGKGEALVLLHAFPLARSMWRPQREALQGECRVITPDLPGFGGTSPFAGEASIDAMADDVKALLDALGITRAVIGGLSMGGYVALAFARKYADRLRGLILADTRAEADSTEAKANRDKLIAFTQEHAAADVIEQMLPKLVSDATRQQRPEVVAEIRQIAAAQTPAGIIGALRALRDRRDSTDVLPAVRVPAVVIVGADDSLTPPALSQAMAKALPQSTLVQIPGAGHLSNLEQPPAFNDAVRAFLKSLK